MRIGVLSDTHGSRNIAVEAVKRMGSIDALIHAGDFYNDALHLSSMFDIPVYSVIGNCDALASGEEESTIKIGNHKIFITHGHLFRVKHTLQLLYYHAQEIGAGAIVFGHTHIPLNIAEKGIMLFNPGSTSRPQMGCKASYGILTVEANDIKGELFAL